MSPRTQQSRLSRQCLLYKHVSQDVFYLPDYKCINGQTKRQKLLPFYKEPPSLRFIIRNIPALPAFSHQDTQDQIPPEPTIHLFLNGVKWGPRPIHIKKSKQTQFFLKKKKKGTSHLRPVLASGNRLAPRAHRLGEVLERRDGRLPVDAGVGDADALLEAPGPLGGDLLVALVDVGLDHDADDGILALAELVGDGGGHLGLVAVVLVGVACGGLAVYLARDVTL